MECFELFLQFYFFWIVWQTWRSHGHRDGEDSKELRKQKQKKGENDIFILVASFSFKDIVLGTKTMGGEDGKDAIIKILVLKIYSKIN